MKILAWNRKGTIVKRFEYARRSITCGLLASGLLGLATAGIHAASPASTGASKEVDFAAEVRPILSNHCFACHGPDGAKRDSGLRLDTAEGLASTLQPGEAAASELIARIESNDEFVVMPPPEHHKPLTAEQKETLRRWIDQGAAFAQHWAFEPPKMQQPAGSSEPLSIDTFIDQRLESAGLAANGAEDPRRLLRRLAFDLTGMPPTVDEVETYAANPSEAAYEAAVDRLLSSPRYGEHMARYWLDLVRYGDTHGLHLDNYREMWPYRDWVINAFNENQPFDTFVVDQLAGDLLPDATLEQQIASGFNRLNVTTNEGGSIYDEVFFRNNVDRVDAFGTVFLGLTTQCAVCHDHKFDPITMKDYYSLYAFFNSLDGRAMDGNVKDPPPVVRVPQPEHEAQLAELAARLHAIDEEARQPMPTVDAAQRQWEQLLASEEAPAWHVLQPESAELKNAKSLELETLEDGTVVATGTPAPKDVLTLEAPLPAVANLRLLQLEVLTEDPNGTAGLSVNGNAVLSEIELESRSSATGGQWLPVGIAYAEADFEQPDGKFGIKYAIDGKLATDEGWAIGGHLHPGPRQAWFATSGLLGEGEDARLRVRLRFESQWSEHQFKRVRLSVSDQFPQAAPEKQLKQTPWHLVGPFETENWQASYYRTAVKVKDAPNLDQEIDFQGRKLRWQPRPDFGDAVAHELPVAEDQPSSVMLYREIIAPSAQTATLLLGSDDGLQVWLNGKQVKQHRGARPLRALEDEVTLDLKAGKNQLYLKVINHERTSRFSYALRSPAVAIPESLVAIAKQPLEARSDAEEAALRSYFRRVICLHPDWLALKDERKGILKRREQIENSIPVTLVWKELDKPREAHVMRRGEYDQPGDQVSRRVPSFLPPLPEDAPRDRLGLARWLVSPEHPLTARVAVNRFWQQIFGTGIVKTSEDFGAQGEPPSHPKLLDYLAIDFQASGWDVKGLMKQIVMSDAYRRSSRATPEMLQVDPTNRLLARGPRFRLDAEMLRDQALAISGLLVEQLGGPSVKPPQPDGLWYAVGYSGSNTVRFKADAGEKIYRRSVYTFWKRTSAPPQMSTFDAPSRESCTARRERTNTPLQALVLMNESQYLEAAKRLGVEAADRQGEDTARMESLFAKVTKRPPTVAERDVLLKSLREVREVYEGSPEQAKEFAAGGDANQAAWIVIANTLLNLDEVVTK